MKVLKINKKDIESDIQVLIDPKNSVKCVEKYFEYKNKCYVSRKIGNLDWETYEIPFLPFTKWKPNKN